MSMERASGEQIRAKVEKATVFAEKIWNRHIRFIGISGSVSYTPKPEDDIDIFIITQNGWLWPELLWAFLVRRTRHMAEICLSLSLDQRSAVILFQNLTPLQAKDAEHVIPIKGDLFYINLLQGRVISGQPSSNTTGRKSGVTLMHAVNRFIFYILFPFQKLKEIRFNSMLSSNELELAYHVVMDPGRLILDTEKYRRLSKYSGEGDD